MASHNGLKYVLETKKGYVMEDGRLTDDINEAHVIDFMQFGFGASAIDVYQRLGYSDPDILSTGVTFRSIIPPYEGRDFAGYNFYIELGYDKNSAHQRSLNDYYNYNLRNNDCYLDYIKRKKKELFEYYKTHNKGISTLNAIDIYELNKEDNLVGDDSLTYYSSDDGYVYKYEISLKSPDVLKYFNHLSKEQVEYYINFQQNGLIEYFSHEFDDRKFKMGLKYNTRILDISIRDGKLVVYLDDFSRMNGDKVVKSINEIIRNYYEMREMHITRMFGSFILLLKEDGELKAVEATNVPIKYCPLMVKLLKEVGGDIAQELLNAINNENAEMQRKAMCNLINEVVIKGGYFDTNRPLNSCEANVTFGASETMYSAFLNGLIDAAVIVSNNLGTIITTNAPTTQGSVKRMTGLFYTTPSGKLMETADQEGVIPVFPYSAKIDQIEGVRKAIQLGYKKIAVSVAYQDNYLHEYFSELEREFGVKIYKFGLCSTGIDEVTALTMAEHADVVWSCASKNIKLFVEPKSIFQVGLKIPVHIMSENGLEIVKNHLSLMDESLDLSCVDINNPDKYVALNSNKSLKLVKSSEITKCNDCPHPCI